ncbi:nucleotide disphospho-sugar-binding domain-containing protein [Sphaerisporangium sp. TRM90804]|uniref:nucleotide disphospho-sugar-binding domain-containing protein n=1 Tax=Sphaerisporangium sp. TRM90804 TaxID=3031113 RepID=UPI0024488B22|nr:nucleotide disphospho-sugar-binding domain-containing protein [Sphaerisporangium sp. TRM90804]MDH2427233.1 DUF1205 domain-containing protein [Sphaerisporangium sp. TRM90804]
MRVLMTSWATASHFRPMVPLGWALQAAGHEVRVACQPSLAADVAGAGLYPVVAGDDVDVSGIWRTASVAPREGDDPRGHARERTVRAMRMFTHVAEAVTGDVLAVARSWRCDLVVFEPRAYAGLISAELLGVPAVRHIFGVDFTYWRHAEERELLEPLWERFGVRGVDPSGTLTIDPFPPSAQIERVLKARTVRPLSYNGPEVVPAWLSTPPLRPRVCVTWGTTFAKTAGHLRPLESVLDGLRGLDVEVVAAVTAAQREMLRDVPAGVRVVESMPLNLLLPSCAAVVHQGGPGTALAAVMSGVPQVLIPSIGDQPLCAERIAAAGAGRVVPFAELGPETVREAVTRVLGDASHAEAADRLRREARRQPAPAELVGVLSELTR